MSLYPALNQQYFDIEVAFSRCVLAPILTEVPFLPLFLLLAFNIYLSSSSSSSNDVLRSLVLRGIVSFVSICTAVAAAAVAAVAAAAAAAAVILSLFVSFLLEPILLFDAVLPLCFHLRRSNNVSFFFSPLHRPRCLSIYISLCLTQSFLSTLILVLENICC